MNAYKIIPAVKDYIWGGNRLRAFGKTSSADRIAETWELSVHPDGEATLEDGRKLSSLLSVEYMGKDFAKYGVFPILTKFIDADGDLSVQVHPSDAYALAHENSLGKSEMWVIVGAAPGAGIYRGLRPGVTKDEFLAANERGNVADTMVFYPVKAGETYRIPAGTVHAIGRGVMVYEIQENSNITYRVYDWGRVGADGKPRPLHLQKAMDVIDFAAPEIPVIHAENVPERVLENCPYFRVTEYHVDADKIFEATDRSFLSLSLLSGEGELDGQPARAGDTFFLPAGKTAAFHGEATLIGVALG